MRIVAMMLVASAVLIGCGEEGSIPSGSRCTAPAGVDAAPSSLLGAFELIDSLPHPVTVACFVESLERPLTIIGSTNDFTFQPAEQGSPRVLAMLDGLVVSWVPSGDGSDRLEFAEERANARSIKAEILMPVERPITAANFEHVLHEGGQGTVCSGCHFSEERVDLGFADFFESGALRVAPEEVVRVDHFRSLHDGCDSGADPRRCDIFEAMFGHGELHDGDFPADLPTIYD